MKKNYIYILLLCIVFTACNKDAEYKDYKSDVPQMKKNLFRVNMITGHNQRWGDYRFRLNYDQELLTLSYRVNIVKDTLDQDTLGVISATISSIEEIEYQIFDYVVNIDQDSVDRLEKQLIEKYGEGNFSLKDSISMASRKTRSSLMNFNSSGRMIHNVDKYYKYPEDFGSGDEFDNESKLQYTLTQSYEYNNEGKDYIKRYFNDVVDSEDEDILHRTLHKQEIEYLNSKVSALVIYKVKDGENFEEARRYTFEYSGDKLMKITSDGYNREFTYNSNDQIISVNTNGKIVTYEYDDDNNLSKITDGDNYMQMTYEKGNGNYYIFTSFEDRVMGIPYVK